MDSKTYTLLKDLPGANTGSVLFYYELSKGYRFATSTVTYTFTQAQIDANPEWFKLKEEPIYTESDLKKAAQDAFVAAKECVWTSPHSIFQPKYKTFQDYLNSK